MAEAEDDGGGVTDNLFFLSHSTSSHEVSKVGTPAPAIHSRPRYVARRGEMHQIEDEPCIASAKPSTNYNTFSSRVLFDLCSLDHPFPYHDTGPPLFRMAKLNIHALRPFFAKKRGMWRRPMLHSSVLIGFSRRGMFDRRFGRALSGLSCD